MGPVAESQRKRQSFCVTCQRDPEHGCHMCQDAASRSLFLEITDQTVKELARQPPSNKGHHKAVQYASAIEQSSPYIFPKRPVSDIHPLTSKQSLTPMFYRPPTSNSVLADSAVNKVHELSHTDHPEKSSHEVVITHSGRHSIPNKDPPDKRINTGWKPQSRTFQIGSKTPQETHNTITVEVIRENGANLSAANSSFCVDGSKKTQLRAVELKTGPTPSTTRKKVTSSSSFNQAESHYHNVTSSRKKGHCFSGGDLSPSGRNGSVISTGPNAIFRPYDNTNTPDSLAELHTRHGSSSSRPDTNKKNSRSGVTSVGSNETSGNSRNESKGKRTSGGKSKIGDQKRSRKENRGRQNRNADSDDNDRETSEEIEPSTRLSEHDFLQCFYHAADCEQFCKCGNMVNKSCYQGWPNITRLIEHCWRDHWDPAKRCERCLTKFSKKQERQMHITSPEQCIRRPEEWDDRISDQQRAEIYRITRLHWSEAKKWKDIFHIIFPSVEKSSRPWPWVKCPGHRKQNMQNAIIKHHNDMLQNIEEILTIDEVRKAQLRLLLTNSCQNLTKANAGPPMEHWNTLGTGPRSNDTMYPSNSTSQLHLDPIDLEASRRQFGDDSTVFPNEPHLPAVGYHSFMRGFQIDRYQNSNPSFASTGTGPSDWTTADNSSTVEGPYTPKLHPSVRPDRSDASALGNVFLPTSANVRSSDILGLDERFQTPTRPPLAMDNIDESVPTRESIGNCDEEDVPLTSEGIALEFHGLRNDTDNFQIGLPICDEHGLSTQFCEDECFCNAFLK